MAWEHQKSGTTILLDILRNVLIVAATFYTVYLIWKWNWIIGLIAAVPLYVVMLNVVGFLTLPIYAFTPEHRLKAKAFRAIKEGDVDKARAMTDTFIERFEVNVPNDPRTEKQDGS